jgi:hypothetical protein
VVTGLVIAAISAFIGIVAVYRVSISPLRLDHSALQLGAANTSLLVQSSKAPIADSSAQLPQLEAAAVNVAQLADSAVVEHAVGRALGVPANQIGVITNIAGLSGLHQFNGKGVQRTIQILATKKRYQVTVVVNNSLFLIHIYAQAATGARAALMADATARALIRYTRSIRTQANAQRIVLTQLGPAQGGQLGSKAGVEASGLVGVLTFLVLGIPALVWRRRRRARRLGTV